MGSWFRSFLGLFALGVGAAGCSSQSTPQPATPTPPAASMDVVVTVPGMH